MVLKLPMKRFPKGHWWVLFLYIYAAEMVSLGILLIHFFKKHFGICLNCFLNIKVIITIVLFLSVGMKNYLLLFQTQLQHRETFMQLNKIPIAHSERTFSFKWLIRILVCIFPLFAMSEKLLFWSPLNSNSQKQNIKCCTFLCCTQNLHSLATVNVQRRPIASHCRCILMG